MIKQRLVSQPNERMLWSQANCKLNSVDNICKHWIVIDNNKIAYFISPNRKPNDHQCNQTVTHALRYFCTCIHTWMPLIWLFNSFYVDAGFFSRHRHHGSFCCDYQLSRRILVKYKSGANLLAAIEYACKIIRYKLLFFSFGQRNKMRRGHNGDKK